MLVAGVTQQQVTSIQILYQPSRAASAGEISRMSEVNDPIKLFAAWFDKAKKANLPEPSAMVLATVDQEGKPSARVVLLKAFDARGFVFYTNLESRKGRELQAQRRAALCFYWAPAGALQPARQVRIEGSVEMVSDAEADAYFAGRPRGAQISAWASQQSSVLTSRDELEAHVRHFEEKFSDRAVPRPPFWSGFRVVAQQIEFWQSREDRLHDRTIYVREGGTWVKQMLYP